MSYSKEKHMCMQCIAREKMKKIRLDFCGGGHSQFQYFFLYQKFYIKLKAHGFFPKEMEEKLYRILSPVWMGQQLLEEQKGDLHYWVQHSPIQEFLPASATDKLTHVYRLYNKKKK